MGYFVFLESKSTSYKFSFKMPVREKLNVQLILTEEVVHVNHQTLEIYLYETL